MVKSRYDKIINALFIVMIALTFFNLYQVVIGLSWVLSALFLILIALHVKDYKLENPKRKKIYVLTWIILMSFFLANVVIVVSEFVYPY